MQYLPCVGAQRKKFAMFFLIRTRASHQYIFLFCFVFFTPDYWFIKRILGLTFLVCLAFSKSVKQFKKIMFHKTNVKQQKFAKTKLWLLYPTNIMRKWFQLEAAILKSCYCFVQPVLALTAAYLANKSFQASAVTVYKQTHSLLQFIHRNVMVRWSYNIFIHIAVPLASLKKSKPTH